MTGRPSVLFVCVHNAGRSQMAAGWLRHLAGERVEVRSAGSAPGDSINPVAVAAMAEVGIDIAGQQPKILTDEAVQVSDVVITMGCGDACPFFPGTRYEDWVLEDPAGQGIESVRPIRDEIRSRIEALVAELLEQSDPAKRRALVAFVALGVIWGSNFIFMKWATETISPAQVTLLRVAFGLLPVLAYGAARQVFRRSHLRHTHHFLVMAVLATTLYYYAYAAGTERLPSGIAGALSGSIPLFSFVSAAAFLRSEAITRLRLLGILVGFAGVLLVARPWEAGGTVDPVGVGLMLLGSASIGLSFVYAKRFLSGLGIPAAALTTYQMALGLLILLVVVDLDGITGITADLRASIALVLGLGLLGTGIAYILYYFIVAELGAVTASGATYIPPVVALAIGWLAVGEPLSWYDGAAVALILTGVVILRLGGRAAD